MKTFILLSTVLAAGVITPAFAAEFKASAMPTEIIATLDEVLAHSRVTVGASRSSVLNEMREPNAKVNPDVWIYTNFHATNVFGAERFDTLVVTFKNDKVANITLAKEEQVRVAVSRSGVAARNIAQR